MDDAALMGGVEGIGDLRRDRERFFERKWAGLEPFGERRPFDELEDQGARIADVLDSVDRADVGMIQWGKRPGLAIEARSSIEVQQPGGRQHLDRDIAIELRVVSP